jgi:flagellin
MTAVLNTNMASLYAQKNLSTAQTDLATSVERLSSGKRINSAADDAAGFAVSQAIASTKNLTDQSIQNTQNAISMVQTASGALDVVGNILQRALTLTTEKEDGSLTTSQTNSINSEITSLLDEIAQIKARTKFQGGESSLFGRTGDSALTFTTGDGSTTTVGIADLSTTTLGVASQVLTGTDQGTDGAGTSAGSFSTSNGDAVAEITVASNTNTIATGNAVFVNGVDSGLTVDSLTVNGDAGTTTLTLSDTLTSLSAGDNITLVQDPLSASSNSADFMNAIQTNSANQADLGTWTNRLNFIVDNMQTLSNNLASAGSRITDTDYAAETANLTRGQILQQAATSMLAQANQMPNVILTLLK